MRVSAAEGVFSQAFFSVAGPGSVLVTALALSLGAGNTALGLIFAAGPLFLASQILGPWLLSAAGGSRKKGVIAAVAVAQGVIFLVPLAIAFFSPSAALATLVVCFLAAHVCYGAASSVWTSWIGDLVPRRIRGRFFGRRLQPAIIAGLVAALAASVLKDLSAPGSTAGLAGFLRKTFGLAGGIWGPGGEHTAFIVIFAVASAVGALTLLFFKAMSDRRAGARRFNVAVLAEPFRDAAFRPLLFLGGAWFFAINFGLACWQPFLLKDLGLSLTAIQIHNVILTASMAITAALWGKLVDRFGNRPVFHALGACSALSAFVYIFMTRDRYWWFWLEGATSGAAAGGIEVIITNFMLALSPERRRDAYVAVFSAVIGACGLVSNLASSQLIGLLPAVVVLGPVSVLSLKLAFGGSALLRALVQIPMYRVHEPRAVGFRRMMRSVAADARLWLERRFPRPVE
jgi:MFS family permease